MKSTGSFLKIAITIGLVALIWALWPHKAIEPVKPAFSVETPAQSQKPKDNRIDLLNEFFAKYKCPSPNYASDYIAAADKYGVDYRLLSAISVQESSCGKHYLYNNLWGYGSSSGLKHFVTIEEGIDYVSNQLATGSPYNGKTETAILKNYGPHPDGKPSPTYYRDVLRLLDQIK